MGFLDWTDAEVIALTRQRRREHAARRPTVRFSAQGAEFTPSIACIPSAARSKSRAKAWRIAQWQLGNRSCAYCDCDLRPIPRHVRKCVPIPHDSVTVDHREPIVLGGEDATWNYAMACFQCNNRKGSMTEAEFRALLEAEKQSWTSPLSSVAL